MLLRGDGDRIPGSPRAAAVSQTMAYPAAGGQLWQNATHNLTAGLRDDAAWGRAYEGGYLTVNKSGAAYANTSLIPPGTYNATHSFTNDIVDQPATDWTYSLDLNCSIVVSKSFLGHSKILNLTDGNASAGELATQIFNNPQTKGSVSYWLGDTSLTSIGPRVSILNTTGTVVLILVWEGNFVLYHPSGNTFIAPHIAGRWYHWSLDFDTDTSTVNVTLDGVRKLTNEPISYGSGGGSITRFRIGTSFSDQYSVYFDAVDYSWTPGWTANRTLVDLSPLGHYNATHSFENTLSFMVPAGWVNSSGINCSAYAAPASPTLVLNGRSP